jgi:hypothetical protein
MPQYFSVAEHEIIKSINALRDIPPVLENRGWVKVRTEVFLGGEGITEAYAFPKGVETYTVKLRSEKCLEWTYNAILHIAKAEDLSTYEVCQLFNKKESPMIQHFSSAELEVIRSLDPIEDIPPVLVERGWTELPNDYLPGGWRGRPDIRVFAWDENEDKNCNLFGKEYPDWFERTCDAIINIAKAEDISVYEAVELFRKPECKILHPRFDISKLSAFPSIEEVLAVSAGRKYSPLKPEANLTTAQSLLPPPPQVPQEDTVKSIDTAFKLSDLTRAATRATSAYEDMALALKEVIVTKRFADAMNALITLLKQQQH